MLKSTYILTAGEKNYLKKGYSLFDQKMKHGRACHNMVEYDRTCVPNHGRTLRNMVKNGKRCAPKHIKTAEYALQNMAEHIRTFVP